MGDAACFRARVSFDRICERESHKYCCSARKSSRKSLQERCGACDLFERDESVWPGSVGCLIFSKRSAKAFWALARRTGMQPRCFASVTSILPRRSNEFTLALSFAHSVQSRNRARALLNRGAMQRGRGDCSPDRTRPRRPVRLLGPRRQTP